MSNTEHEASRADRRFVWVGALLLLWQLGWIVWSWPYVLDDTLIHLRYAENLLRVHRITYDGVHASFGTSSLLYVSLLAALLAVWHTPLLPRVVSSMAYVGLYVGLFAALRSALRRRRDTGSALWWMALLLLAITVSPAAVRWLDDGMESGLVLLDALVGVLLLRRLERPPGLRAPEICWAVLYGVMTVLLRVEMAALVGLIAGMAGYANWRNGTRTPVWQALLPLSGALAAMALVRLTMGALLPDTAVAKAYGFGKGFDTLKMAAQTMASAVSFGLGLVLLWIASAAAVWARKRAGLGEYAAALFPLGVLAAAAVRGQQIQGVRYFGWTLLFPLLWNWLRLADLPVEEPLRGERAYRRVLTALAILLVPVWTWESARFGRVFAQRNAAFHELRSQPLERLRGQPGIAEDVGLVGYFTGGDICDPYGLINGRAAARMHYPERLAHCLATHPAFVFGSLQLLHKIRDARSLAGWSVCGTYNFQNLTSADVHYLLVGPRMAPRVCAAGAEPVATVLPELR